MVQARPAGKLERLKRRLEQVYENDIEAVQV
jgi:hypothetical protein